MCPVTDIAPHARYKTTTSPAFSSSFLSTANESKAPVPSQGILRHCGGYCSRRTNRLWRRFHFSSALSVAASREAVSTSLVALFPDHLCGLMLLFDNLRLEMLWDGS